MTLARATPTAPRRPPALTALVSLLVAVALGGCGGGDGGGSEIDNGGNGPPPGPQVAGPAWRNFGSDVQHTALSGIATQDLNRIAWSTPMDLAPQYRPSGALLTHYGSPVVTSLNTVIVPVKTGAGGGFRIEARAGTNGGLVWSATTDYVLPSHNWVPSYNVALTSTNRLFAPGAGGKLLVKNDADVAGGGLEPVVFYGATTYAANPAAFNASVFINTPITIDAVGNAYFGFVVTGANPAGLSSGFARIGANGATAWVGAAAAAAQPGVVKPAMNSAPALSIDGTTLYVAVNSLAGSGTPQTGALLALDAATLAVKGRVALVDPGDGTLARVSDDGTASPTVGPDGHVYFGVLEAVYGSHNARGWLLHFDATLATSHVPGSFGWDDTASVVPATLVAGYTGASSYLLMVKYNNYYGAGGDGANRLAVIDPGATQTDPFSGLPVMKEVLTIIGPTFESGNSGPVEEWCINTAAVDPFTRSILVNSEDGYLYRWSLVTNQLTQRIRLTGGLGQSYTPTVVGADGAVYAVNNAVLFSIAR